MIRPLILAVVVFCAAHAALAQDPTDETRKLQGVWAVTAAEQRGKPFDAIKGGVLSIAEGSFALKTAGGNEFRGDLRINPAVTPRQLDFVHGNGGPVWEAIYSVNDDVLRLNYVEGGGGDKRPTIFATTADTGGTVIVMRRVSTLGPQ